MLVPIVGGYDGLAETSTQTLFFLLEKATWRL